MKSKLHCLTHHCKSGKYGFQTSFSQPSKTHNMKILTGIDV